MKPTTHKMELPPPPRREFFKWEDLPFELLANCIYSTQRAIAELYRELQAYEAGEGIPLTPTPPEYLNLPPTRPYPCEEDIPPPAIRCYCGGLVGNEIWRVQRSIGGGNEWNNRGYVDLLKGIPAEPPTSGWPGLVAQKGMYERLEELRTR